MTVAPLRPLRRLYDWTMELAAHRLAVRWLALVSFAESVIFPIPPDVMLIPMVLAARHKAFQYAAVCSVASVLGGAFGYLIGFGLMEGVGRPILALYGYTEALSTLQSAFNEHGWLIVVGGGLTPLPYKIVTIASGAMELDFALFMVASLASRSLRFFAVAGLLWLFGEPIRRLIEERFGLITTLFFILLVGGFVAVRYLI